MDRGLTIENPYASVAVPRAQVKDGFLQYYLGDESASDPVLFSPSAFPVYSAAPPSLAWNSRAQEELPARPANPYASLKVPPVATAEPFHWKSLEGAVPDPTSGGGGGSCSPCCPRCGPCCRKCCCSCVIS